MARKDKTIKFASNIEIALMITDNLTQILTRTIKKLSQRTPLKELARQQSETESDSSGKALEENIALSLSTQATGHYDKYTVSMKTTNNRITTDTGRMHILPAVQLSMCIPGTSLNRYNVI